MASIAQEHFASEDNALVVSLPHARLVCAELPHVPGQPSLAADIEDVSEELGLALLRVKGHSQTDTKDKNGHRVDPIGQVLILLQDYFSTTWSWVPTMGRNRLVGHVDGTDGIPIVKDMNEPKPFTEPPTGFEERIVNTKHPTVATYGAHIGMVDTVIRPHTWLVGQEFSPSALPFPARAASSRSASDKKKVADFRSYHSTFVLGLLLKNAPHANVAVQGVISEHGSASSWEVAKAIAAFRGSGIDVLNLSLACYTEDGKPPLVLSTAIDCLDRETLVVAAAGNYGAYSGKPPVPQMDLSKAAAWPAALDTVVAVGSATAQGARSAFSPDAPWVDVLCQGEDVESLYARPDAPNSTPSGFATWGGTSFSAAQVSAAIAARTIRGRVPSREAWQTLYDSLSVPSSSSSTTPSTPATASNWPIRLLPTDRIPEPATKPAGDLTTRWISSGR